MPKSHRPYAPEFGDRWLIWSDLANTRGAIARVRADRPGDLNWVRQAIAMKAPT